MSNVVNLEEFKSKMLQNNIKKFVDIYIEDGANSAGVWAKDNIDKSDYNTARDLIREEFISRGYTFKESVE